MSTNNIAFLFPGQGSQAVGMCKELLELFPATQQIYEEASDALSLNLRKLCLEGPADELQLTYHAQPAILTTSYAWLEVLRKNLDLRPAFAAGHSLGEYTALVSAGALTFGEAVKLVKKRGELMQSAVPVGVGKMAAVLGLDDAKVEALCAAASQGTQSLVVPANYNSPGQVVIAGHATAVDRAEQISASGANPELKARKFIPLSVSAPFHCPLMKPVAEAFVPYLQAVAWKPFSVPVAANLDAKLRRVEQRDEVIALLRDQIDHPVRWTACAKSLQDAGAKIFIEMGPGRVLTGLIKRVVEGSKLFGLESHKDFTTLEKAVRESFQ